MARFEFERGFFIGVLLRLQFFFFSLFSSHCLPFKPSQTCRFGLIDPCSGLIQMLTGHNCHVNHSVVCFDGFRKNSVLIQLRNFFQCPFFPMGIGMACSRKGKMKLLVFFFLVLLAYLFIIFINALLNFGCLQGTGTNEFTSNPTKRSRRKKVY